MSWRELNPIYWRRRLREMHRLHRGHPHRRFTAAELQHLRKTAAPYDLNVLRGVIRRNIGRV